MNLRMNYEGINPESLKKKTTERILNIKRALYYAKYWFRDNKEAEQWEYCHKIVVEELNTRPHVQRNKGNK